MSNPSHSEHGDRSYQGKVYSKGRLDHGSVAQAIEVCMQLVTSKMAGTHNIESRMQKMIAFGESVISVPSCRGKILCTIGGRISSTERRRHETIRALAMECLKAGVSKMRPKRKILHDWCHEWKSLRGITTTIYLQRYDGSRQGFEDGHGDGPARCGVEELGRGTGRELWRDLDWAPRSIS